VKEKLYCEVCGRETSVLIPVIIDGALVYACPRCAKLGTPVKRKAEPPPPPRRPVPRRRGRGPDLLAVEWELVEDYGRRIREARNRLNMTLDELASRVGERRSALAKIERGELRPTDQVIARLERVLGIKLRFKIEEKS